MITGPSKFKICRVGSQDQEQEGNLQVWSELLSAVSYRPGDGWNLESGDHQHCQGPT